mmetsp:Transcript_8654/g.36243  ORF Transcript_8654/g.36243 Transcript_8654/m.36243 type:complete len:357 (+) Transcript_8654:952-2022(+)
MVRRVPHRVVHGRRHEEVSPANRLDRSVRPYVGRARQQERGGVLRQQDGAFLRGRRDARVRVFVGLRDVRFRAAKPELRVRVPRRRPRRRLRAQRGERTLHVGRDGHHGVLLRVVRRVHVRRRGRVHREHRQGAHRRAQAARGDRPRAGGRRGRGRAKTGRSRPETARRPGRHRVQRRALRVRRATCLCAFEPENDRGRDRRAGGRVRLRQVHRGQTFGALLRPCERVGAAGRTGHLLDPDRRAARGDRGGVAGAASVPGHDPREHRRRRGGEGRGVRASRRRGRRRARRHGARLHRLLPGRVRHRRRGQELQALRRAEAADRHCQGGVEKSRDFDSRRSHLRAGHRERALSAGCA